MQTPLDVQTPQRLSPGMCRLLNAAAMDNEFCALLLSTPALAARLAEVDPGDVFGGTLPDDAIRLPPIVLDEADRHTLRRLPPAPSLASLWQRLVAGDGYWDSVAAPESVTTADTLRATPDIRMHAGMEDDVDARWTSQSGLPAAG